MIAIENDSNKSRKFFCGVRSLISRTEITCDDDTHARLHEQTHSGFKKIEQTKKKATEIMRAAKRANRTMVMRANKQQKRAGHMLKRIFC